MINQNLNISQGKKEGAHRSAPTELPSTRCHRCVISIEMLMWFVLLLRHVCFSMTVVQLTLKVTANDGVFCYNTFLDIIKIINFY